nr:hypothetical protein GCM10020093_086440 [Planobispora longispora]
METVTPAAAAGAPEAVRPGPAERPEPVEPTGSAWPEPVEHVRPGSAQPVEPAPPAEPVRLPESAEPVRPAAAAAKEPDAPVRWGDLTRPVRGDLLVHPPRPAAPDPGHEGRISERVETWGAATEPVTTSAGTPRHEEAESSGHGASTQPMRVVTGDSPIRRSVPTPRSGSRLRPSGSGARFRGRRPGGSGLRSAGGASDRRPPYSGDDAVAPPSSRVRSTPSPGRVTASPEKRDALPAR